MNLICQKCPEKCKQAKNIKISYCPLAPKELFNKTTKIINELKEK